MAGMGFPTVWEDNSPPSLIDLAIKHCIEDLDIILSYSTTSRDFELREGFALPMEICNNILRIAHQEMENSSNHTQEKNSIHRLLKIFQNPKRTRVSCVDLSNTGTSDEDLETICQHNIESLNISGCSELTSNSLIYINGRKASMQSLVIGPSINVFAFTEEKKMFFDVADKDESTLMKKPPHCNYIIDLPGLRKLVIEGLVCPPDYARSRYFQYSLRNMPYLVHLDLSRCAGLNKLECLQNHKHLLSLILYNIPELEQCFDVIRTIPSLRHLDISQAIERHVYFRNPNRILKSLVQSLPNLVSLDISGTNLAGDRVQEREEENVFSYSSMKPKDIEPEDTDVTDIAGLKSRVKTPLEFLGLYNTAHEACYRHHIPSKVITGEANQEQILAAGRAYISRPEIIQKVLNDLFHIFRFSQCDDIKATLDVVMEAMRRHMEEKHIQISGSASLFYIVKGEQKVNFNIRIKRNIIKTLLDAMFAHISDVTMVRNGCLTLIHFKIPEDVFFDYERLVNLLLLIIQQDDQDEFVQRIGVYLLNTIACQVDGKSKQLVGDRGAISVMLQLISGRLTLQLCDEVMETAWSTMWNVTDETPINCLKFLEGDGMTLFLNCLKAFPGKSELLRNMMGLLGNVAEVKELRPCLMTDEYLTVFSDLLCSKSDGIEVSYNAAGILSHIASDGLELWDGHSIVLVSREAVLSRMVRAIQSWNLNSKRNINYRSFGPILRLLQVEHSPEAQYWAIWALANLTNVYPEKYCALLKEEGGIPIIEQYLMDHSHSHIRELAAMVANLCKTYEAGSRPYDENDMNDDF